MNHKMEAYINEFARTENTKASLISLFSLLSIYENTHNVNIENFDRSDWIKFFNDRQYSDSTKFKNDSYTIGKYLRYINCEDVVQDIDTRDIDFTSSIRSGLFASYEDVYRFVAKYRSPDEGFLIHPLVVFAWMGVPYKSVPLISDADVLLDKGRLNLGGDLNHRFLSELMIDVLCRYKHTSATRRDNHIVYYPLKYQDKFLFRMSDCPDIDEPSLVKRGDMSSAFVTLAKMYGKPIQFNYTNILRSGNFYRMRELELSGIDVYDVKNFSLIRKAFGLTPKSQQRHKDIIVMYDDYKQVFNLR